MENQDRISWNEPFWSHTKRRQPKINLQFIYNLKWIWFLKVVILLYSGMFALVYVLFPHVFSHFLFMSFLCTVGMFMIVICMTGLSLILSLLLQKIVPDWIQISAQRLKIKSLAHRSLVILIDDIEWVALDCSQHPFNRLIIKTKEKEFFYGVPTRINEDRLKSVFLGKYKSK